MYEPPVQQKLVPRVRGEKRELLASGSRRAIDDEIIRKERERRAAQPQSRLKPNFKYLTAQQIAAATSRPGLKVDADIVQGLIADRTIPATFDSGKDFVLEHNWAGCVRDGIVGRIHGLQLQRDEQKARDEWGQKTEDGSLADDRATELRRLADAMEPVNPKGAARLRERADNGEF